MTEPLPFHAVFQQIDKFLAQIFCRYGLQPAAFAEDAHDLAKVKCVWPGQDRHSVLGRFKNVVAAQRNQASAHKRDLRQLVDRSQFADCVE